MKFVFFFFFSVKFFGRIETAVSIMSCTSNVTKKYFEFGSKHFINLTKNLRSEITMSEVNIFKFFCFTVTSSLDKVEKSYLILANGFNSREVFSSQKKKGKNICLMVFG